jgi:hypothetical protein
MDDTLLHPDFHFTSEPAGTASKFDGFRELTFANQFVKPFVGHTGVRGDKRHINKRVFGTE